MGRDFRARVIGETNPSVAPSESLRGAIFSNWRELGLQAEPNIGNNGVHASASPFEGLAERANWLNTPLGEDPFGKEMLAAGIPLKSGRRTRTCFMRNLMSPFLTCLRTRSRMRY